MTTGGLKGKDFRLLANIIHNVLSNPEDQTIKKTSLNQIEQLSNEFKLDR